jgi:hypothetical protein
MFVVFSLMFMTACGGSTAGPAAPTPVLPGGLTSLSGIWTGTSVDTSGQENMMWGLTQSGNAMTGTMTISDGSRSMMGTGSMQGTISGATMTFHMSIANGGFSGMMSSCSMLVDGQAQMSEDGHTMTGTYSGRMSGMMSSMQSCGDAMNDGHFTLTR